MKQDKKELYESIMASVAKEVKKILNESEIEFMDFWKYAYLKEYIKKFRKLSSTLTIDELRDVLMELGVKRYRYNNHYVYSRYDLDGIIKAYALFLNTLYSVRKRNENAKKDKIKREWDKIPIEEYEPEMSNMQNASDELLRQDEVYYENMNESHIVENLNNEEYSIPEESGFISDDEEVNVYDGVPPYSEYAYFGDCVNTVDIDEMWDATEMLGFLKDCEVITDIDIVLNKLQDGDRKIRKQFKQTICHIEQMGKIHDLSEICAAINDVEKILVIYISKLDKHFFFDCII